MIIRSLVKLIRGLPVLYPVGKLFVLTVTKTTQYKTKITAEVVSSPGLCLDGAVY